MFRRSNSLLLPLTALLGFVLPNAVHGFELSITQADDCDNKIIVGCNMTLTEDEFSDGYYWQNYIGTPSNPTKVKAQWPIAGDFSGPGVVYNPSLSVDPSFVSAYAAPGSGDVRAFYWTYAILDANNQTLKLPDGSDDSQTVVISLTCNAPVSITTAYSLPVMSPITTGGARVTTVPSSSPSGNNSSSFTPPAPTKKSFAAGLVVGGAVGGIAAVLLLLFALAMFLRRRQRRSPTDLGSEDDSVGGEKGGRHEHRGLMNGRAAGGGSPIITPAALPYASPAVSGSGSDVTPSPTSEVEPMHPTSVAPSGHFDRHTSVSSSSMMFSAGHANANSPAVASSSAGPSSANFAPHHDDNDNRVVYSEKGAYCENHGHEAGPPAYNI
ncbi:unnamed protein product [Tilletia controversa]|nr:unnamed protein product [Tilletia controversa]